MLAASVAMAWSAPAWSQATLPQGGQVVHGDAAITQAGAQMTIQQASDKAILNWQSFDIGAGHQVTFQQPNASAVALNRVLGADASTIHGTLQANGRVFLVNPNGMLFGAGANVNVGGLVASTLNIADNDFLQGLYQFSGQGSNMQGAALRNEGRITAADGGAVALLGGSVSNQGTIAARLGSVALAAGNQVKLDFAGDGLLNVQVQQSSLNALVENHQLIEADGGNVLMTAKATDALLQTVVNNTGTVRARSVENREGKIVLLGGFEGGTTRIAGTLDASAPDGGNGGFVETSGASVKIDKDAKATTLAANSRSGSWLITANDFTVARSGGDMTGQQISDALNHNGNVTIRTAVMGTAGGQGDIHINDAITWTQHTLRLDAQRNININAVMSVNGNGALALNYGNTQGNASAIPLANSNLNFNAEGRVDFAKTGSGLLSVNGHGYEVINNLAQLQGIGDSANLGRKYALGGNIDASVTADAGFTPIGNGQYHFTGVFDGLGHTVSNLTITRPDKNYTGLFGSINNATLRNIGLVGGSITGRNSTGALVGAQYGSSISNAYATSNVTGADYVGGLVGSQETNNIARINTISNAYATGNVTGSTNVGGLVGGQAANTNLTDNLSVSSSISNSYATGNVTGGTNVGGLVGHQFGYIFRGSSAISINNAYATGNVTGEINVGGLVGQQFVYATSSSSGVTSSISNAYATGNVKGTDQVGGLVGFRSNSSASSASSISISNTYATGSVIGISDNAGGLIGGGSAVDVANSFWDTETTGQTTSSGGQGLTTAQMKQKSSFTDWDISDAGGSDAVWRIYEGHTAPLLRSFMKAATVAATEETTTREYNGQTIFDGIEHDHSDDSLVLGTLRYTTGSKNAGAYSGNDLQVDGLFSSQLGYDIRYGHASLTIAPKQINVQITAEDKTYDGTTAATLNTQESAFNGKVTGDSLTVASASGIFSDKNADNGKSVNITGITLGGADAGNYTLATTTAETTANITKATIANVSGIQADDRTYDGTTGATLNTQKSVFNGKISGDELTVTGANGNFLDKNADIDKHVNITSITLGGADARNYSLDDTTATASANIFKATISSVSGIQANDRTYDGTTGATLNTQKSVFNGKISGDELTVAEASGSFLDKNADVGKHVNITSIALGGADARNYTLDDTNATASANIFKATISSISGIEADNRTYDGTTGATLNTQKSVFNGKISGDELTVAEASGSFLDKNADVGKNVNITDIALGGADARNYTLNDTTATASANIFKATISSVSGIEANDRNYDGTTGATLSTQKSVFNGKILGDELTVADASGNFLDKNADVDKHVNITSITLGGADARNYTLNDTTATASANIFKATISSVSGIQADDRTYDGTTGATLNTQKSVFNGKISGDELTVTGASGSFLDKNADVGKRVNITSIALGGADANNYTLDDTTATASANIFKATISSVSGIQADDRTYDGTTGATLNAQKSVFNGKISGDELTVAEASGSFLDKNADVGKHVNITDIALGGADARNYTLNDTTATASANIFKATISSVSGIQADNRTYDGTTGATLSIQKSVFNGKISGDELTVAEASGSFLDKNADVGKHVNITSIALGGADARNYTLDDTNAVATANIHQLAVEVRITADDKIYDATTAAITHGQLGALLGDDQVSLATNGSFVDKNAGIGKTVTVSGTLSGADAGNYRLVHNETTKADIGRLEVMGTITADHKTYDGNNTATTQGSLGHAILGQDQVTLTTTGRFADRNAGQGKAVALTGELGGADSGNYVLVYNESTKADIDQRAINATITADGKIYDATTTAITHGQLGSLLGDDQVSLATSGSFAEKNAGLGKTVNVSGALSGADAGNYRLEHNATTTASIDRLAIHADITAHDKVHDGTTSATTQGALTGVLAGDHVALQTRGSFLDPAAGTGKLVQVNGTLDGEDGGNYRLEHNASTWATIHPVTASIAAAATDIHQGAHPSRIDVARAEASAPLSGCFGDVYPMPALVMNLAGLAVATMEKYSKPAIVFASAARSASDRACARTPF